MRARPLLAIPGWSCGAGVWSRLLVAMGREAVFPDFRGVRSAQGFLPRVVECLRGDSSVIIGSSMGGLLAVQAATERPESVEAVVLVGSTSRFVATDRRLGWPVRVVERMRQRLSQRTTGGASESATSSALSSAMVDAFRREMFVDGEEDAAADFARDSGSSEPVDTAILLAGLDYLMATDTGPILEDLRCPVLWVHGTGDVVCPPGALERVPRGHRRVMLSGAGHLPAWTRPLETASVIDRFLSVSCSSTAISRSGHDTLGGGRTDVGSAGPVVLARPDDPQRSVGGRMAPGPPKGVEAIDKRLVALRFGRHADRYDAMTPVQRSMREILLSAAVSRLEGRPVGRILELGCGPGGLTNLLAERFPGAEIVSVELSEAMAAVARSRALPARIVVADAEEYVLRDTASYDLVISNAAMQWFIDPEGTVGRCRERLADGGVLAIATFGTGTLWELRESFDRAYEDEGLPQRSHVLSLPSIADWRRWLPGSTVDETEIVCSFDSVRDVLASIRGAGASLSVADRRPVPRTVFRRMVRFYERQRWGSDGGIRSNPATRRDADASVQSPIPATYHVLTVVFSDDGPLQRTFAAARP